MVEDLIYMWYKYLYQDNVTNLMPGLISPIYVTNLTNVTTHMPTCTHQRF